MPYGVKDASKVSSKGRRIIVPENLDVCPVCNKNVAHRRELTGLIPLAPIKVPRTDQEGFESVAVLGCAQCYQTQARLSFHTVEALTEYRASSRTRGRPTGSTVDSVMHRKLELAPNCRATKSKRILAPTNILKRVDINLLESLYESLGKVIEAAKNIAPEDEVLGAPPPDDIDDDDLEAGMTDEQRARMDEAVAMAKARDGKIPQENPSGW